MALKASALSKAYQLRERIKEAFWKMCNNGPASLKKLLSTSTIKTNHKTDKTPAME